MPSWETSTYEVVALATTTDHEVTSSLTNTKMGHQMYAPKDSSSNSNDYIIPQTLTWKQSQTIKEKKEILSSYIEFVFTMESIISYFIKSI